MKNTIIFDLDGTLLNTLEDLKNSINFALEKNGFPKRSLNEIRSFVGNGIKLLVERSMPQNCDENAFDLCYNDFCAHYKEHMNDNTAPYDGVLNMLKILKENGFKTAIVTNKAAFAAKELCDNIFGDLIGVTVGAGDGVRTKPHPDGVYKALDILDAKKCEAVFVGDSDVDIATANNAGLTSVGVLWGFRDRCVLEKAGAAHFCETVDELCEKLLNFQKT